jgi:CubicO group peptidase (beta-lactamase class C family)
MGRGLKIGAGVLLLGIGAGVAVLVSTGIPRLAAGMAARSVCSAVFVAGRGAEGAMAADVLPASPALALVRVTMDPAQRATRGTFAGAFERVARYRGERGCVLDAPEGPAASGPSFDARAGDRPWPEGNQPLPRAQWGERVNADRLKAVIDQAFVGAGDPKAANARAVAVIHQGRLLVNRQASGFAQESALHGWSMTKTVTAMLAHKLAVEKGLDTSRPVVDSFAAGKPLPAWVETWKADARAKITLDDLLAMRDGLANEESYAADGAVPRMLFGATDVAAFAAAAPAEAPAGTRWRYLSASTNILSRVLRSHLGEDKDYWAWPRQALFEPIGARSAVLETDADGTWIGSSYLWASSGDWARLGELMRMDGMWNGQQVLPPGFLGRATRPALAEGEGRAYGAQTWLIGEPTAGRCKGQVPPDTIAMQGHWGQIVAIVPSRQAVIVRLGWTFNRDAFDNCRLVADVLATLTS